jgi:hypothetical protein
MFLSGPRPLGYPSKGYRTVFYGMALLNRAGVSRRQSTHLAPQQTRTAACEFQDRHRYLKKSPDRGCETGAPGRKAGRGRFVRLTADKVVDSRLSFGTLWPPRRRGCGVVLTRPLAHQHRGQNARGELPTNVWAVPTRAREAAGGSYF